MLLLVSFANNIAWLGDGSDFYTSRMQISKDRIALGLAIIDRNLAFYSPDPEWAGSLVGDDLGELMSTSYKDSFMGEAGRCFDHWNQELAIAGIADDAIDDEQRSALLVLMSENALGLGSVGKTLGELIQFAGSPATDNGVLTQFTDSYTTLAARPLGILGLRPDQGSVQSALRTLRGPRHHVAVAVDPAEMTGRRTRHELVVGNVARHRCAGGDHREATDRDATDDRRVRADRRSVEHGRRGDRPLGVERPWDPVVGERR